MEKFQQIKKTNEVLLQMIQRNGVSLSIEIKDIISK